MVEKLKVAVLIANPRDGMLFETYGKVDNENVFKMDEIHVPVMVAINTGIYLAYYGLVSAEWFNKHKCNKKGIRIVQR